MHDSQLPHLAAVVKRRREAAGLSQEEAGAPGRHDAQALPALKRGRAANPTLASLLELAKALDVPLETLVAESRSG